MPVLPLVMFEVLNCALVLFSLFARRKRAKILPLFRLWLDMTRVNPKLAGLQFANHLCTPLSG